MADLKGLLADGELDAKAVVEILYSRALFRIASEQEEAVAIAHLTRQGGEQGIKDLLWALFNHPDFLHR